MPLREAFLGAMEVSFMRFMAAFGGMRIIRLTAEGSFKCPFAMTAGVLDFSEKKADVT